MSNFIAFNREGEIKTVKELCDFIMNMVNKTS